MTDLIRPEARALLARWAETGITLALAALGTWWAATGLGIVRWAGVALAALALGWGWSAVQRARFRKDGDGPGVVQVIEGEIRFFGPSGGGFVPLEALDTLALTADNGTWLITSADGAFLAIPRAAQGAEALFDAFAALPGFEMAHLLRISAQTDAGTARMIWSRPRAPLLT
jgi:hypothetical protein